MDFMNLGEGELRLLLLAVVLLAVGWFAFSLRRMLRQQEGQRRKPADRDSVREDARRRL